MEYVKLFWSYLAAAFLLTVGIGLLINKIKRPKKLTRKEILEGYNKLGDKGEAAVGRELSKLSSEYTVYNDITLKVDRGIGTSQIDHLVVSPYGLFVIETKNWMGKIYAKPDYESWVRIRPDGKKNFFGNAIKQNEAHIDGLISFLPRRIEHTIFSLVAFSRRGTIVYDDVPGIGYYNEIVESIEGCTIKEYSDKELKDINRAITSRIITSEAVKKQHVRRARASKYARR